MTDAELLDACSRSGYMFLGSQVRRIYALAKRELPSDVRDDVFYDVDYGFYQIVGEARMRVNAVPTPASWMAL